MNITNIITGINNTNCWAKIGIKDFYGNYQDETNFQFINEITIAEIYEENNSSDEFFLFDEEITSSNLNYFHNQLFFI